MNKDTLHLAGRRVGHVCTEDCPLDKHELSAPVHQDLVLLKSLRDRYRQALEEG